jgi:hypothetical protein
MLLVGYAYAHILVRRLVPRWQIGVHLALLVVICLLLPLKSIAEPIRSDQQPVSWLLGWLTVAIGPAFFALAATTPLLWELPLVLVLACFLAPYDEARSRFGIAGDLLLPATLFALLMVRRRLPIPDWQPIYPGD